MDAPRWLSCSQNAHYETGGNGARVVPCSRSAHDGNLLAQRAQWTTTDAIPREEKQESLEGSLRRDDASFDALSKSHPGCTL